MLKTSSESSNRVAQPDRRTSTAENINLVGILIILETPRDFVSRIPKWSKKPLISVSWHTISLMCHDDHEYL